MYFKPPQNNFTNPFYHPLNQVNEQKYTKARVMFNNASDARRDMRVAKETGLYQSATEKPSGRGRVYEITFKSEGQFRRFMSQFEVDLMEYPLKEGVEIDEAVKTKVEKTSQGFQVMVFSPKVKKFIPQGSPHKTKAEAEKDAKMFEDVQLDENIVSDKVYRASHGKRPNPNESGGWYFGFSTHPDDIVYQSPNEMKYKDAKKEAEKIAKEKGLKKIYVMDSYDPELDEGSKRFGIKTIKFAKILRLSKAAKEVFASAINTTQTAGVPGMDAPLATAKNLQKFNDGDYVGALVYLRKNLSKLPSGGRRYAKEILDALGDEITEMSEDVQLDEKKLTPLTMAFSLGRKAHMSGKRREPFKDNRLKSLLKTVDSTERNAMNKEWLKGWDEENLKEDVQLDEVTGETTVMAKGDRNQYERISRALTAAKKAGKIAGYEGAHYNYKTKVLTLIFDSKAHKPASERRKVAKMIKDFGLEFSHSVEEGLRQAMSKPKETPAQKQKRQEKDNFDLYKKRQARIAALRGDRSSRKLTKKQEKDYMMRVNLDQIKALDGKKKR